MRQNVANLFFRRAWRLGSKLIRHFAGTAFHDHVEQAFERGFARDAALGGELIRAFQQLCGHCLRLPAWRPEAFAESRELLVLSHGASIKRNAGVPPSENASAVSVVT